jgi:hypothetical protein
VEREVEAERALAAAMATAIETVRLRDVLLRSEFKATPSTTDRVVDRVHDTWGSAVEVVCPPAPTCSASVRRGGSARPQRTFSA